jgi:hypothetical protein
LELPVEGLLKLSDLPCPSWGSMRGAIPLARTDSGRDRVRS